MLSMFTVPCSLSNFGMPLLIVCVFLRSIFYQTTVPNFRFKDLPLVLILIIADYILNDSLCSSNKYI